MRWLDDEAWRVWSRVLQAMGVAGCLSTFLWLLALIGYYSFTRPIEPSPERGWTVRLQWTHGAYGTPKENDHLLRLHYWFAPFFIVAAAGAAIQKLHEKNEPWRKKQF